MQGHFTSIAINHIDCPATSEDMKSATFIYGPENKRGKTTRYRLDPLAMIPNIPLPANIIA